MAKAKPSSKHVIDVVGDLIAYSPVWQNGVALPVLVEFDTPVQQHNFLNATSVNIQYVDLGTGKKSLWPRTINIAATSQSPFTVSVSFVAIDPNAVSQSRSTSRKLLHGTGSGTIIYTDVIGTHEIDGTLTLYNLSSLTETEFLKIFTLK